jgi:hypothetical protein
VLAVGFCSSGLVPSDVPVAVWNVVLHPADLLSEGDAVLVHLKAADFSRYVPMTIFNTAIQGFSLKSGAYLVELVLFGAAELKEQESALAQLRDNVGNAIRNASDDAERARLSLDLFAVSSQFEGLRHGQLPPCSGTLVPGKQVTVDIVWTATPQGPTPRPEPSSTEGPLPEGFYSLGCNDPKAL